MWRYLLLVVIIFLTGCSGYISSEAVKQDVDQYNSLVSKTLESYEIVKSFLNENKSTLLAYILTDNNLVLGDLVIENNLISPLTEEEIKAFSSYDILHDYLFTSYGSSCIREVIYITGKTHDMVVTVIWGHDSILTLERKVVKI